MRAQPLLWLENGPRITPALVAWEPAPDWLGASTGLAGLWLPSQTSRDDSANLDSANLGWGRMRFRPFPQGGAGAWSATEVASTPLPTSVSWATMTNEHRPGASNAEMQALTVQDCAGPKSRCGQAGLPPKAPGEGPSCSFQLLGAPSAGGCVPWPAPIFTRPLPCGSLCDPPFLSGLGPVGLYPD